MTKEEFYEKWNPGGTFNNPYSERDKSMLDNRYTHEEFMADLDMVITVVLLATVGQTTPTCTKCLSKSVCDVAPYGNDTSPCKEFIPTHWQSHVYFNKKWWPQIGG